MPAIDGTGAHDWTSLSDDERATFAAIADHLIPAAHGMPSAADVVTTTDSGSCFGARPDLGEPLQAALRAELGADVAERLAPARRDEPANSVRAPARHRRRLLHRQARPRADRVPGPGGASSCGRGSPGLSRGRPDRRRARARPRLARPGDRAAGRRSRTRRGRTPSAASTDAAAPEGGHDGHDRP